MRTGSGKDGPIISDNGNIIMDCDFGTIDNPAMLSDELSRIPGLVEHGIFTNADVVYIGYEDHVEIRKPKKVDFKKVYFLRLNLPSPITYI